MMTSRLLALPLLAAAAFHVVPAMAQAPRASGTAGGGPGYQTVPPGVPSFKDPKTGQVWTPDNVGGAGNPALPQDRAFNPQGQAVSVGQVYQQNAQAKVVGAVPITAGPTVPLVALDDPSLSVVPGARWMVVIYLQNNSASTLAPSLNCNFTNGGNPVMATIVAVPPVQGGSRVGLTFFGPPADIFVDGVGCNALQP